MWCIVYSVSVEAAHEAAGFINLKTNDQTDLLCDNNKVIHQSGGG